MQDRKEKILLDKAMQMKNWERKEGHRLNLDYGGLFC